MTASRIVGATAAVALALTLSACGGGGGGSGSTDSPSKGPRLGAIDQLWQDKSGDYDQDAANAEQMKVEELVAKCMTDQGFEYTPVDYSSMNGNAMAMPAGDDGSDLEWGTLEFAKKYGYGQTTNPWGDPVDQPTDGGQEWVDPNQAYLESMTETEMTAYQTALYGVQPNFTDDADWENWNPTWEEQGCYGAAQHEVNPNMTSGGSEDENKWADLEAEMQTMYESLESDPRVTEAVAKWASCMADAGYPGMATITDAETMISDKVQAVYEDGTPYDDLGPDATQEDYEAADAAMQELTAAITPEEIEVATADFTCREDIGYQDTYDDVNVALQQEFYDAHKTELDAYVTEMSGGVG